MNLSNLTSRSRVIGSSFSFFFFLLFIFVCDEILCFVIFLRIKKESVGSPSEEL